MIRHPGSAAMSRRRSVVAPNAQAIFGLTTAAFSKAAVLRRPIGSPQHESGSRYARAHTAIRLRAER